MEGETAVETTIQWWKDKGYTQEHIFPNEYVLLIDPDTGFRVRIYKHEVWMKRTGDYIPLIEGTTDDT